MGIAGATLERLDGGQGLALEELQEGAATGRDIGNAVGDAILCNRRQGIATTGDGECP